MPNEILYCQAPGCGVEVSDEDYDDYDDELDPDNPLCPTCSESQYLQGRTCEHCTEPATHLVELGPLCEEHYQDYADGMFRE